MRLFCICLKLVVSVACYPGLMLQEFKWVFSLAILLGLANAVLL